MAKVIESDLHVGGTPCVDYSLRGTQGGLERAAATYFITWILMRAMLQETYVLHENVPAFDVEILLDALGSWYEIESIVIDASQFGWPMNRKRRYTVLRHRVKSLPFRSPLTIFTQMFFRSPLVEDDECMDRQDTSQSWPKWSCFLVATLEELKDDIQWASSRPLSQAKELANIDLDPLSSHTFHTCLTEKEEEYLKKYSERFPGLAYSLNQDPEFGPTRSSRQSLQCLIKNMGILWTHVSTWELYRH